MRRRRPEFCLLALLACGVFNSALQAQRATPDDGALFLLLPVGARATSMGQAVTATSLSGESLWWNPGGLASVARIEAQLNHSQSIAGTGDAISIAFPSQLLGVFTLGASTVNFGEQELGGGPRGGIGLLVPRSFVFAASYATSFAQRLRAGLTYKLVQLRNDCSGACEEIDATTSTTSAIDFGLQWERSDTHPFSYGLMIRNVGPRLQVVDNDQADALPSRVHLGVEYRVTPLERSISDTRLHVSAEALDRLELKKPVIRLGSELRYQERLFLRAGYNFEEGGGPSIGGGVVAGRLAVDIARVLGGLSANIGEPPTFVSLRFRF